MHAPTVTAREGKHLIFALGGETYGLHVGQVREIVYLLPVTHVPGMPEHVLGVVNLRGRVLPLVDLRRRLGLPAQAPGPRACVVVTQAAGGAPIGVLVDAVSEVVAFKGGDFGPPPDTRALEGGIVAIARSRGAMVLVLDVAITLREDLSHVAA